MKEERKQEASFLLKEEEEKMRKIKNKT